VSTPYFLLNESSFSDSEVTFVLTHEVGHIKRHDSYRPWARAYRKWAEDRELQTDIIGAQLSGCEAMKSLLTRHRKEFIAGWKDESDPHPHPDVRYGVSIDGSVRKMREWSEKA
jgi:Zn-dependent protease with chaperone function